MIGDDPGVCDAAVTVGAVEVSPIAPAFAARLRDLRQVRGLGVRQLARSVPCSPTHIVDLEAARKRPSTGMVERLDAVLDAGGALIALVSSDPVAPEQRDRMSRALEHPTRLDGPAVAAFADVLAAYRRLDDLMPPQLLLPSVQQQWDAVQQVARQARGSHATEFAGIAAEWTQFLGWLHAEARHDAQAARLLTEATDQADDLGDGPLTAQAVDFRAWLDRQRGHHRGAVRHGLAAYHTPGSHPLQRACNAAHAASGLARLGDHAEARRLLREAEGLLERAPLEPPRTAYWLTPMFIQLGIGLAWLGMGERAVAAEHLRAGLESLPAGHVDSMWAEEYRVALTEAVR